MLVINWARLMSQVQYISYLYLHHELQMSHYIQVQLSWQTVPSADDLRLSKAALMHPNNNDILM